MSDRAPDGSRTFRVSADAYDRFVGRYGPALGEALVARASVRPGHRALDVGCGPGALTGALVSVLGPGSVAAVDPSEPFVEACRATHPGVDVRLGRAERLPFDDAAFDVVLSQLVVNFLDDPRAGLQEMIRVARPSGTIGAAVWDYADGMTLLRTFWDAATALDPAAAGADEARVMRHATREALVALWDDEPFAEVDVGAVVVEAAYADFDDLWWPLTQGVGPAGAYTGSLAPEAREALRDEMRRRLAVADGPFTLTARAWVVVGRLGEPSSD